MSIKPLPENTAQLLLHGLGAFEEARFSKKQRIESMAYDSQQIVPMTYDSLKHVIQHLEANKRIQLTKRCPAIRGVDRAVPLKISFLKPLWDGVQINGNTYRVGTEYAYHHGRLTNDEVVGSVISGESLSYPLKLVSLKQHDRKIEKVECCFPNRSYDQPLKYLCNMLFGGRSGGINAINVIISSIYWKELNPFTLDFKIHIEHLLVYGRPVNERLDTLRPIIHDSSFPLKYLECFPQTLTEATHPIIKGAIALRAYVYSEDPLDILMSMSNPFVRVNMVLTYEILKTLLKYWITTANRPIGSEFTFTFERTTVLRDKMEEIREHFNGETIDGETIILPMNEASQFKIGYGEYPQFAPDTNWALRVSVETVWQ